MFVVEQVDAETQSALAAAALDPHMQMLVVPAGEPRTKPRAIQYALQFAQGDYVVVLRRRGCARARSAAPRAGGVRQRRRTHRLPAGAAQHLQLGRQLVHAPVHHRVHGAVRLHPAGAGAAAAAGAARRHVEPLPARRARCRRRVGSLQRHRGRRPRHPPGASWLARRRAAFDDLGGGAADASASGKVSARAG